MHKGTYSYYSVFFPGEALSIRSISSFDYHKKKLGLKGCLKLSHGTGIRFSRFMRGYLAHFPTATNSVSRMKSKTFGKYGPKGEQRSHLELYQKML